MMTEKEIIDALKYPCQAWDAEPCLGSIYGEEEIEAAVAAIRSSMNFKEGFGFSSEPIMEFEKAVAEYVGVSDAIAVNSCGPGQDILFRYLNLQPGDEVIVPSINYDSAPLAVIGAGGTVVWGESRASDYLLDPEDVERKITPRTRAIFPVHIHGNSAPMDEYIEIANRHPHPVYGPPKVIADAARGMGGDYKGTKIGKLGYASAYSLHTMKNMTTLGEGGLVVTDDAEFAAWARRVRMYGRSVGAWGTSNVMTKVQAAVGLVQLKKLDSFIANRRRVAAERNALLADLPEVSLPLNGATDEGSFYLYCLTLCDSFAGEKRDMLIKIMKERYNVVCWVANPPIYEVSPYLAKNVKGETPYSSELAKKIICVPIHPAMTSEENRYISAAFIKSVQELR